MSDISNLTIAALFSREINFSGAELVELGITLVAEFFGFILIVILFRTYPFHIHLWILMLNLIFTIMVYSGLRMIIVIHYLYKFNVPIPVLDWMTLIRYIAIFQESFNVFAIVIERSLAAKFSKKYERVKFNVIPISACISAWAISSILVFYSLHRYVIPFIVLLGTVLFIWTFSIIIMIILFLRLRQKRLQRMNRFIAKHQTLSKRYQIKENIKSTKFLLPVISFLTVTACSCTIVLFLSFHTSFFSIRCFEFIVSLRGLIVPIIVARIFQGHCAFRNQLIALIATATNIVSNSDTDTLQSRATRSGGQVYAVMSAVDMHFQNLRNAWEMTQSLSRP